MKVFWFRSKVIQGFPGLSTLAMVALGFLSSGCDSGERDLFTNGFECQSNPLHADFPDCTPATTSTTSGTVSFVSPNELSSENV